MSEIESILSQINAIDSELNNLSQALDPLLAKSNAENIKDELSCLDNAKLNAGLAYGLNTLYYSKLSLT